MRPLTKLFIALGALALAGCAGPITTRNAPLVADTAKATIDRSVPYTVTALNVNVPQSLRVSEANVYYPIADIVWRDDPFGDRHAQVQKVMYDGLSRGARSLKSGRPVAVDIEVRRFHSLTEKVRYKVGGVHSIKFEMVLRDPATGEEIERRLINGDLRAYGGTRALAMEMKGVTQKFRIENHLARLIYGELNGEPS